MKKRGFRFGLRAQLTVILLVVSLVPLATYGVLSVRNLTNRLSMDEIATMQAALDEKSVFVQEWLGTYQSYLQSVAADPRLIAMDTKNATPWLRSIIKGGQLQLENIGITDLQGLLVGGSQADSAIGKTKFDDRDYFKQAVTGKVYVGEPVIAKTTGSQIVPIAVPIRRDNQVVGVLFGTVLSATLQHSLNENGLAKQGARAYLISQSGQLINTPTKWGTKKPNLKTATLTALAAGRSGSATHYQDPVGAMVDGVYAKLDKLGWGLVVEQDSAMIDQKINAEEQSALMILLAAALVVILFAWVTARSLTGPIARLKAQLQSLATGDADLTARIRVSARNEIGEVAEVFNLFMGSLQKIIREVKEISARLSASSVGTSAAVSDVADASSQLTAAATKVSGGAAQQASAADEVNRTMAELQQTIQQIASGAQQTASETQESSRLLEEIVATIDGMAVNAEGVASSTTAASAAMMEGAVVVKTTLDRMDRVREAVTETAGRIGELQQYSAQIGEISQVISGIADQTNLLALNAAIEAARAGEHGRGFAVVADEVRKLAERSAQSAREINSLITSIQTHTERAVTAMSAGTAEVEASSGAATEAGRALEGIKSLVEQVAGAVASIASASQQMRSDAGKVVKAFESVAAVTEENTAATEEMAAGATLVADSVGKVAGVSRENAAASEQVSTAVEQLNASARQMTGSAEEQLDLARRLQEEVARFTV